jgi:O-antigen/teichoic acid export membrane protein
MPPISPRNRRWFSSFGHVNAESLRTEHLRRGLTARSIRGGAVTLGAQGVKFITNLLSIAILARLLSPSDFGIVAMVFAITAFMEVFRDLGLTQATIQRNELAREQVDALFWVNALLGIVLAALCWASGPLVAAFYEEPRLRDITSIAALGFIMSGLTVQYQAILNRQMRFGALVFVELAALITGASIAITMAWLDFGFWSLAWAPIGAAACALLGMVFVSDWTPRLPRSFAGVGSLLRFGGHVAGFNVMNYFARNLDNLLIGKVWGAGALGLYSRAYSLLMFPMRQVSAPIGAVAFPALCALQTQPDRFRRYYLNVLFLIVSITTPLCLALVVLAPEVVSVVLGAQWSEAAGIFRLLAIASIVQPVCATSGWLYLATGNSRGLLVWGSVGSLWLISSFFIGLPYGPNGVAASYAVASLLWVYPCMALAAKGTSVPVADIFRVVLQALLASAVSVLWLIVVKWEWGSSLAFWMWAAVGIIGMGTLYWIMLTRMFGKGPLFRQVLHELRGRWRSHGPVPGEVVP